MTVRSLRLVGEQEEVIARIVHLLEDRLGSMQLSQLQQSLHAMTADQFQELMDQVGEPDFESTVCPNPLEYLELGLHDCEYDLSCDADDAEQEARVAAWEASWEDAICRYRAGLTPQELQRCDELEARLSAEDLQERRRYIVEVMNRRDAKLNLANVLGVPTSALSALAVNSESPTWCEHK